MSINVPAHQRRSIRLKGYDYSHPGAYFVTIVTQRRECLLGELDGNNIRLSKAGVIVQKAWHDLPSHYPHVQLDEFCIMPNHVHGIIILLDDLDNRAGVGAGVIGAGLQTRPYLSEIVRAFKSFSARRINVLRNTPGIPVWQRNYYEHIIRNAAEWERIRAYIQKNPQRWVEDREYPSS